MKSKIRPLLAVIAVLLSTILAKAQETPVTIYGREYHQTGQMAVTVLKPDVLKVDRVRITSKMKTITVRTRTWDDPAVNSLSEEVVLVVPLKKIDLTGPVVLTLLRGKTVVGTYKLDTRSTYGRDFLDFYCKL